MRVHDLMKSEGSSAGLGKDSIEGVHPHGHFYFKTDSFNIRYELLPFSPGIPT